MNAICSAFSTRATFESGVLMDDSEVGVCGPSSSSVSVIEDPPESGIVDPAGEVGGCVDSLVTSP